MRKVESSIHSQSWNDKSQHCKILLYLLKGFERLIDVFVRNILMTQNFYQTQRAYQKGKSVKTAPFITCLN